MSNINLTRSTILVTGAASMGIGAGICRVLSDCGARLVINDITSHSVDKAVANYPNAVGFAADISSASAVDDLFADIKQQIGPITGLVNNAGVGLNRSSHEASEAEFDQLYNVDVRGLWMVSRAFVRQLLHTESIGSIVNISSVHAHSTNRGYAIYASAKAAVESLSRGMAVELGINKFRVNAVAPGYVSAEQNIDLIREWTDNPDWWIEQHTHDQQALRHEISSEDVGWVVAFLLSDLSRSITGQSIYVDNGMTAMLYNNSFFD